MTASLMKAVTFDPATDSFNIKELPVPSPEGHDVLIKVKACGLNPVDTKVRFWKEAVPDMDANWVNGLDVAGTVVETGAEAQDFKIGDTVLCHGNMFRPHGGFAEYTIQDSRTLITHPDTDSATAASSPCAGWTAWRALHDKLSIEKRESILITGASGGVGGFAVQIAKAAGVKTIIGTCSARNHEYVKQLGATHVLDYKSDDVVEKVLEITGGKGVDVGVDAVGGDNDILVADSLTFDGQMVEIVIETRPSKYRNSFGRGLSFHQLALGAAHGQEYSIPVFSRVGKAFCKLMEEGKVTVPKLQTVSIDEVPAALEGIMTQRTVGKIVLTF